MRIDTLHGVGMPKDETRKVFLDANVIIAAGKPPGGPVLARVRDLVEAGLIAVLTTDLTVTEVAKKHAENDFKVIAEVGRLHFRKLVEDVLGTKLPTTTKAEIKAKLTADYDVATKAMFDAIGAKTLKIDDVKPSVVFRAYANSDGFFNGEGKKDQFPDAFIFECLRAETDKANPVIIVSSDGDFDKPVVADADIALVKSIPDLFSKLGLQVKAPEIDNFLEQHKDELIAAANSELGNAGLIGDVEDSEIDEVSVIDVDVGVLRSFGSIEKHGPILVVGQLTITANLSFTHPDWDTAAYDSEDKVLIPFDHVAGETEVQFNVDASMSILVDDNGEPEEIEDLQFRQRDFYFELHPSEIYK